MRFVFNRFSSTSVVKTDYSGCSCNDPLPFVTLMALVAELTTKKRNSSFGSQSLVTHYFDGAMLDKERNRVNDSLTVQNFGIYLTANDLAILFHTDSGDKPMSSAIQPEHTYIIKWINLTRRRESWAVMPVFLGSDMRLESPMSPYRCWAYDERSVTISIFYSICISSWSE